MRRVRLFSFGVVVAAVSFTASIASLSTPSAQAGVDHFSGTLWPGLAISSAAWHNWDRVRSRYPGHQAHNVKACVYMSNLQNGTAQRGGVYHCAFTWSEPYSNPIGWNFGDTWANVYQSHNDLHVGQCCTHTLYGWTSDNQTDG